MITIFYSYIHFLYSSMFLFPYSQWGTPIHDIPPLREGRKLDVLEKINFLANETETCQGQFIRHIQITQNVLFAHQNR